MTARHNPDLAHLDLPSKPYRQNPKSAWNDEFVLTHALADWKRGERNPDDTKTLLWYAWIDAHGITKEGELQLAILAETARMVRGRG